MPVPRLPVNRVPGQKRPTPGEMNALVQLNKQGRAAAAAAPRAPQASTTTIIEKIEPGPVSADMVSYDDGQTNFPASNVQAAITAFYNLFASLKALVLADIGKVFDSSADTTAGYLSAKIAAGSGVTLTTLNPGANEQIQISATGGGYSIGTAGTFQGVGDNSTTIFDLGATPVSGSVRPHVGGVRQYSTGSVGSHGWSVSGTHVVFGLAPASGAQVVIDFATSVMVTGTEATLEAVGDGSTTTFALGSAPLAGSVRPHVGGVRQYSTGAIGSHGFTVSGGNVTFGLAPASGAQVVIDFQH